MSEQNKQKLDSVFRIVFSNMSSFQELKRGQHPWDSLKHIELLNKLENEFQVSLTLRVGLKMTDLASVQYELENLGVR